ncbi:MAG: TonB-dependent siderophore receptor [Nostoc sp.]|uniref:TonB-dependent siderophore receptor n=1 Tax=Nostoc sp. TaxID=1180 RepID=UPI002FFCB5DB
MEQQKLSILMCLTAAVSVFVTFPAYGDVEKVNTVQWKKEAINSEVPITNIPQLSDIPRPPTSVKDWLAQEVPQNQVIQVTGVRLNSTASGLEVILETPTNQLQSTIKSEGNTFSAVIPNAQLNLPSGNSFRAENPRDGITEVVLVNQDANSILVTVKGTTSVPKVELLGSNQGLISPLVSNTSSSQQQTPNQGQKPIELLVTGEPYSYKVPTASTGTKFSVPLRDIPLSVQVIPSQVIEDRQIVRQDDITDNVSGVQKVIGYGTASAYTIRGFADFGYFRNGFRGPVGLTPGDTANIESIEVLKGPAAVLYGSGYTPGGLLNVLTKKPLDTPLYNTSFIVGSYDYYRSSLDFTGPLTTNNALLYRLNASYENAGSYRDFINNQNLLLAPALTWQIDKKTTLSTQIEYQKSDFVFDSGLPLVPQSLQIPISRSLAEPGANTSYLDSTSITYTLERKFSDNWSFKQGFNALLANLDLGSYTYYYSPNLNANGTVNRLILKGPEQSANYTLTNELFGKFSTGSINHNVLIGVELYRRQLSTNFTGAFIAPINIFNPVYGAQPGSFSSQLGLASQYGADDLGIYVQDLVEILPNLKLLAGVRFDSSNSFAKDSPGGNLLNEQVDNKFSPRAGIVYQPSKTTSLYFNWSDYFNPVYSSRSKTGELFKPQTSEQFEVGIKQEFLENRLSATLAFYEITRQNLLTADPTNPLYSIQTGEQKSRGIELDVTGQILPGWKVIGTYTYTDAFVSQDNTIPVGNRLIGVPYNSASLWTTYELQSSNLKGLGFGLGLVYSGDYEVALPNTFTVPSYLRADAALFYRRNKLRIGLNFNNVFNTQYYYTQIGALSPASPFNVRGSVSFEF